MTEKLDLSGDVPVWGVEIYHSEKGATNPWTRVLNAPSEKEATDGALELFAKDSLNVITIYEMFVSELLKPEGGEKNA